MSEHSQPAAPVIGKDTPELEFSIVLCTRDRAELLKAALASIAAIDYAPQNFELLVIDNDSSDDTARVANEFARSVHFAVRVIHEKRRGLSAARNRGIRDARGRYLFFTDDDQLVDVRVLAEYRRILSQYPVRVVQGAIELKFSAERPAWLYGTLARVLGETGPWLEGQPLEDLFGGNLLLSRDLFEALRGFDEALGKGRAGYSEDTEFALRLRAGGEKIIYAPSARIYHVIGPDRATVGFFVRNAFQKGRSHGWLETEGVNLWGWTRASLEHTARHALHAGKRALRRDAHGAIVEQVESAFNAGKVAACLARWAERSRSS